ncbi:DUF2784 domain-containing protein [Dyella halodurans]|uniref:DUF2784 domain-containing protein n=1 Tax=Dyella halodurans TaxID=1920171 RepID=A0ABV9C5T7_9GAMM|nr:DUF2784 domain-containing protein [Dyella halodurans]
MARLADTVLVVHALLVLFIVGGFVAIWVGAGVGWPWIRERTFRVVHLCAIGVVAALPLLGIACPLTELESWLRTGSTGTEGFLQHWVSRLLYYDLPAWVFTLGYALFALLVLLTWFLVPPRRRQ